MAGYITEQIVRETWQQMSQTPIEEAPLLVEEMSVDQPYLMGFFLSADEELFNQDERETLFYIGMVIWQIMKRGSNHLGKVSRQDIQTAQKANDDFLELLMEDTEADFNSATRSMLDDYPEPEVLRYIVEAVTEVSDDPREPGFSEENVGMAFLFLKTALDALINSQQPDGSTGAAS